MKASEFQWKFTLQDFAAAGKNHLPQTVCSSLDLVCHCFKDIAYSVEIFGNPGDRVMQVSYQGSAVDDPQSIEKRIGFSRVHERGYQRFVT